MNLRMRVTRKGAEFWEEAVAGRHGAFQFPGLLLQSLRVTGESLQENRMMQSRGTGSGSETLWLLIWVYFLPWGPFHPYPGEASPMLLGSPVRSPEEMMART